MGCLFLSFIGINTEMSWLDKKKLPQPKLQTRERKEYWQRRWRQKVCFQSLGPVTKPVQGFFSIASGSEIERQAKECDFQCQAQSTPMLWKREGYDQHCEDRGIREYSEWAQRSMACAEIVLMCSISPEFRRQTLIFGRLYHYGTLLP